MNVPSSDLTPASGATTSSVESHLLERDDALSRSSSEALFETHISYPREQTASPTQDREDLKSTIMIDRGPNVLDSMRDSDDRESSVGTILSLKHGRVRNMYNSVTAHISRSSFQSSDIFSSPYGYLMIPSIDLAHYIKSNPRLSNAGIQEVQTYSVNSGMRHMFIMIKVHRRRHKTMWIRMDRSAERPSNLAFVSNGLRGPVNDMVRSYMLHPIFLPND
jgi:hypothetical protein